MDDATLEVLSLDECTRLLAAGDLGRVGIIDDGEVIVLPVNYRWIADEKHPYIAIRTRPGNVIDTAVHGMAFEIDGIDEAHHGGWSVLVRGTLHRAATAPFVEDLIDPHPWLKTERDSWLVIVPDAITGRRLSPVVPDWAFHIKGYL